MTEPKIKRCGDCMYWMDHHVCPYERWSDGRWYGPSMGSIPCEKYKTREEYLKEPANA